ncbi:ACP S-malonyltransferase [Sorangium sp. So ce119]|uniref:ACP S-malonyltransferase n=1 Tax=Sorangium sp. So ce119 TaxID=3133279 RepID=UPI003F608F6D
MLQAPTVLLFPGQGSQSQGMGAELARYREVHDAMLEASDVLGLDVLALCCTDGDERLRRTELTQPAILTISVGVLRALQARTGLRPDAVAGHSLGEYSALVAAGGLRFDDALRLVRARGQHMAEASGDDSTMLAYLGSAVEEVEDLCTSNRGPGAVVEVANYNAPTQLVLSGHTAALRSVAAGIEARALGSVVWLSVSGAFHSSLMEPVAAPMRALLDAVGVAPLSCALAANVDARIYERGAYGPEQLVRQLTEPVLWIQSVRAIERELGAPLWIEIGPGNVLEKLVKRSVAAGTVASTRSPLAMERALRLIEEAMSRAALAVGT